MEARPVGLNGPLLLVPEVFRDPRGFVVETFRQDDAARAGIREAFVQHSQSRSTHGTVRGLHFQVPPGQAKLVRVARGAILDVLVDIRRPSATFGQHVRLGLDDANHHQLYIPPGFAHGFCVLSDEADVVYGVSEYYHPDRERGIAWDDPDLGITWPVDQPTLSNRDQHNPLLRDLDPALTNW
jgi:dTDP-4-dehydrorhamnose 3,5-epimerase